MIKAAVPRLSVCSACLRRGTVSGVRKQQPSHQPPWSRSSRLPLLSKNTLFRAGYSTVASDAEHDVIREVFDQPLSSKSWLSAITPSSRFRPTGGPNVGLFKNGYLTRPQGFQTFAVRNLQKASVLVDKVLKASSVEEYRTVVRSLDRLSDLLCRVLDLCDFVRMTHPDRRFQDAAGDAWAMVYQYMNQLNTTTGLNDQLCAAMGNPEVTSAWSDEEMIVAQALRIDFEKSAVHLPEEVRDRFVDLSQRISEVGSEFVGTMSPQRNLVNLPESRFQGADPLILQTYGRGGRVRLYSVSGAASLALRQVIDGDTRKALYLASHTASHQTITLLEEMLRLRGELAGLSGFESYAHQHLQDRMMAKTPAAVAQFLTALQKHNAPIVRQEVANLLAAKRKTLGEHHEAVEPWDVEFCKRSIDRATSKEGSPLGRDISNYFSVGTVIKGLSILFSRLYGIRFVPKETLPGEVWHPEVRRLDVVSEKGDLVAVLYCDLFSREAKSPNPAHYTVRCSRDILEDEVEQASQDVTLQGMPKFESAEAAANDGMETVREDGVLKQIPTIALVCDFQRSNSSSAVEPALLSPRNVETLFHEMGHAAHSILARTSFQNVAGTRCATDLAELPSTLMEHFALDPTVLSLFARHWKTGEALPYAAFAAREREDRRRFEGMDTERQIILAMADQVFHSPAVTARDFSSTTAYHRIQAEFAAGVRDDPSTSWQGFFGHLQGYGSTYYSYLFDRVLAERVWRVVFKSGDEGGAVSRENGEWLKEKLLRWGGGRDPWRCMADTLRDERIAKGDEKAMAIVGSWGIKD